MHRRLTSGVALTIVLCGVWVTRQPSLTAQDQAPPPTFRTGIVIRDIDVTVTTKNGELVTDLRPEEIEVVEDGTRRRIETFAYVPLPVKPRDPVDAAMPEADVQTNQGPDGRLYLIVMDSIGMSGTDALKARQVARLFIERHIGTNDRAAVVFTRGRRQDMNDFTSSHQRLLAATETAIGGLNAKKRDEDLLGALDRRTLRLAIQDLLRFLGTVPGPRKAMVLFTSGDGFTLAQEPGDDGQPPFMDQLETSEQDAIGAAARIANISLYPVDVRGLDPDLSIARSGIPELRSMAAGAGGFAIAGTNNFERGLERLVRENSGYYVVGYTSDTNAATYNKAGRVKVQVTRPGVTVRLRYASGDTAARAPAARGRTAARPAAPADNALSRPVPAKDIPMRLFTGMFKGANDAALIVLATEIDVRGLELHRNADGVFADTLDFQIVATDKAGKSIRGPHNTITTAIRPNQDDRPRSPLARVVSQMSLKPGRYQVRVAVGKAGGKAGSVIADLDVPDFTARQLTMSSIALRSTSDAVPLLATSNPLGDRLPGPLTTNREFATSDTLTTLVEIYHGAKQSQPLHLRAQLRTPDGVVARTVTEEASLAGVHRFVADVPLNGLEPGRYVLHIEARGGQNHVVAREIPLTIVR